MDYTQKSEDPENSHEKWLLEKAAVEQFADKISNTVMKVLRQLRKDDKTDITESDLNDVIRHNAAWIFCEIVLSSKNNGVFVYPHSPEDINIPCFYIDKDPQDSENTQNN